jgi:hypothetical protein
VIARAPHAIALFACALAALAIVAPARAQSANSSTVTPAIASVLALIECNDGTARTFQNGVVAGSNGVQSFVITADMPGPDGKPFSGNAAAHCNAPIVHFADDPAASYASTRIPMNFAGLISAANLSFYVLVVERPRTPQLTLASGLPESGQSVLLAGFATDGSTRTATQAKLAGVHETYATNGAAGSVPTFGSSAKLRGAAVIDVATGHLLGFGAPVGPYFRSNAPPVTAYDLAGHDTVVALLRQMPQPAVPGATTLTGQALQAARLTAGLTSSTMLFMQRSSATGSYTPNGFAVVLGTTATTTVLAASYLPAAGSAVIVVTRHDGSMAAIEPTLLATDSGTTLAFFAVPKFDTPLPAFGPAPPLGSSVAIPHVAGFACEWNAPEPAANQCPIAITFEHVVAAPELNPTGIGITTPSSLVIDSGAPLIDVRTGAIVGLKTGQGAAIPISILALKADALNVGIHVPAPKP